MVERNVPIFSKQENDDFRIEYIEIMNGYIVSNNDDPIDDVWDVFNIQKVLKRKPGKFLDRLLSEDDRK